MSSVPSDARRPAKLTALTAAPFETAVEMEPPSGRALLLYIDRRVSPGTPVKVETEDSLLLGEVRRCEHRSGAYHAELTLAHTLEHTADLARLAKRLLMDSPAATPLSTRQRGDSVEHGADEDSE